MVEIKKLDTNDGFSCCYPIPEVSNKILLGTREGYFLEGEMLNLEEIKNASFSSDKWFSVLKNEYKEIVKLDGEIRTITKLNDDEVIVLSSEGAILMYNILSSRYEYLQNDINDKYFRLWRLIVLDENNFLTVGNYSKIKHWFKDGDHFSFISLEKGWGAYFCLDYISSKEGLIFVNNYNGNSKIFQYKAGNIKLLNHFKLDGNLQKCILFEDELLIAVDYFGTIHIYQIDSSGIRKIDEFTISSFRGNWIHYSTEIKKLMIGTEEFLILIDQKFEEIKIVKMQVKQMFTLEGMDLILLDKTIVRDNYQAMYSPDFLQKYKYLKIGLVGDSQVGKTCFCRFLETNQFQDTKSSYGRHVWTLPIDEKNDKRLLYYDLAGQGSELFTYFPMISDASIILLFYQGIKRVSFDLVIEYYDELVDKCPNSKFYFIQTFADQGLRFRTSYIKKKFEERGIDFDNQLVVVSPKDNIGFDDFQNIVIDQIDWDIAPSILKLKMYEAVENEIHKLYNEEIKSISINDLSKRIELRAKVVERIIQSYNRQGIIEYIEESKEVIINDEEYEKLHSQIAEILDEEEGYAKTSLLIEELGDTDRKKIFINNIIKYYRENQIGIFFKEETDSEVIVFPRKIEDGIISDTNIRDRMPKIGTSIYYNEIDLDLNNLLLFLGQLNLDLLFVSKTQIVLETAYANTLVVLDYNVLMDVRDDSKKYCSCLIEKQNPQDSIIEENILEFLLESVGDNVFDFDFLDETWNTVQADNPREILKNQLNYSFEKPYFDFKMNLDLSTSFNKAELLKDLIALANSSFANSNYAYLAIGFKEKGQKVESIHKVESIPTIEQTIINLAKSYLNKVPRIQGFPVKISEICNWKNSKEIDLSIHIDPTDLSDSNAEVLLLQIERDSNEVYELAKEIKFEKHGKEKQYYPSNSWIRISSHTFYLHEYQRLILRKK